MSTGTPKSKVRVESEIEKNREEGNWNRCLELSQQLPSDQGELIQFLMGEAKLEKFLESGKESGTSVLLMDATRHLKNCLNGAGSSPLAMDTNLLLAKAHFVHGDYAQALKCIEDSGIEPVTRLEKTLPLRVMKLVAESFAVKGMSLDKEHSDDEKDSAQYNCMVKATELSLRYIQNMEKVLGQYAIVILGSILDSAIVKCPSLLAQKNVTEAICHMRSTMNAVESQSTLGLRQTTALKFAETLLKNVSSSSWPTFDTNSPLSSGPWKPHRYIGQSLFVPKEREEEICLLLMISELLASRNVVLDRSPEFEESRTKSLEAVTVIYDLFAIALTPFRHFYLDCYERAMKFSFETKHIWMQFALTLMESKKNPLRASQLFEEVSRIDKSDPLPLVLAAKLNLTELDGASAALRLSTKAFERCKESNTLYPKICLLIGIANAIIYEESSDTVKKTKVSHFKEAVSHFKLSTKANPEDHLPYYHLSLLMCHQRAIQDAIEYAHTALLLNPTHLPTIEILILCLTSLKQHEEALELCEAALQEYPEELCLMYIKCHLEELVSEDGLENALLTAKYMLKCWKIALNEEQEKTVLRSNSYLTGANYDTMSLRMEQTISEITSLDSIPLNEKSSGNSASLPGQQMWNIHMNIWIMIVELYLKLEKITEAEACVNEGVTMIFGPISHQMMFINGYLQKSKGNYLEAKSLLQNAIAINPKHAKALQQLGHTYYMLGNCSAAEKYLRDSLSADSSQHETWSYLGLVLDAIGDHDRALDSHSIALQLEATDPVVAFKILPRVVLE
ncbi:Tetratricopeptide repeat protein 7B [Halotydeus destructor]|nr:Tetratricopeptide repeat protein 7B [Halotydeus destructor]